MNPSATLPSATRRSSDRLRRRPCHRANRRERERLRRPPYHCPTPRSQGQVVERQILRAPRQDESLSFRFQLQPESARPLILPGPTSAPENDPDGAEEATRANNQRLLVIDRRGGPFRILYVGGRPNWEYKYLQRSVAEDDQLQLVALLRLAYREPRFEFRGRAGETTNPLFRGFDRQTEETERYDQPVLIRLHTRDRG
jgi:hypothetical protein